MPIKYLAERGYTVIGYFMNPNIHPLTEYMRRAEGVMECAERLGIKVLYEHESWELPKWLGEQLLQGEPPHRCQWCVGMRLKAVWRKAYDEGIPFFSSSLLYSIYQPHDYLTDFGKELSSGNGPDFFYYDFREFWHDGINISREWQIYRQPYCGCVFSEAERYQKKFGRLKKICF